VKKPLLIAVILLAGYGYFNYHRGATINDPHVSAAVQSTDHTDASIYSADTNHENDLQVSGQGVIIKLLPDDISGSRHQRFIIKSAFGQTLLVAHNIDLAPRVASIHEGDSIQSNGEYEWSEKRRGFTLDTSRS
jgi:hypothetical protein